jgi:hypothetical protein
MPSQFPPRLPRSGTAAVSPTNGACINGEGRPCSAQGMISAMNPFVDLKTGTTTPISYRFLWGLFSSVYELEEKVGSGGSGGGIPEAPIDGTPYCRQDASWVSSPAGSGGGIIDAPTDGTGYGRQNAAWTPVLMKSGDILDGGNF